MLPRQRRPLRPYRFRLLSPWHSRLRRPLRPYRFRLLSPWHSRLRRPLQPHRFRLLGPRLPPPHQEGSHSYYGN
jgi:hypothetical protein